MRLKSPVAFERKVAKTSTWGGTKTRQVQCAVSKSGGKFPSRVVTSYSKIRTISPYVTNTALHNQSKHPLSSGSTWAQKFLSANI